MNLKIIFLLFILIENWGLTTISAADGLQPKNIDYLYKKDIESINFNPIEPSKPKKNKIAKVQQPRFNRILYRMGFTLFLLGGMLIFVNLATFAVIQSFSVMIGLTFYLGAGWIAVLTLASTLFLILYAVRLIDDSVIIQSKSQAANFKRAKKRFWLSLPLMGVLAWAAFLSWFYYVGIALIFFNAAAALLVLIFTIWDIQAHWYKKNREKAAEKNYE